MTDRGILRDRLNKIQKAVHKATEDAWKQQQTQQMPPRSSTKSDSNASFLLGMDLFGQDVSTLEMTIREKLEDVESDLQRLLKEDSSTSFPIKEEDGAGGDDEEEFVDEQELEDQVQLYRAKIAFLKQTSLARTALDESKTASSCTLSPNDGIDLVQASRLLVQALELVRQAESFTQVASSSGEELENFNNLMISMKHEIRRHRVQLICKAGQTLDTSVQMTQNSLLVKNTQQLDQAYHVLEQMEGGQSALKETLRRFSTQLYNTVMKPILLPHQKEGTESKTWKINESEDTPKSALVGISANKGPVYRLEWTVVEDGDDGVVSKSSPVVPWKQTFELLTDILVFTQSKILMNRQEPSQLVGDNLFGDPTALPSNLNLHALGIESRRIGNDKGILLEDIMERLRETCIPDIVESDQEITYLHDLATDLKDVTLPFCKAMCQKHLIPMSPKPKLIVFCDSLEENYIQHRRCVLLNQARGILVNNDYHNTVQIGSEASEEDNGMEIFKLQSSSISDTAKKLMELVRKTMDEAVAAAKSSSLPLLRPTLYKTAREMLSLFRAIVPASHKKEINQVPRTAAVLHNDCIFLAHNCLTLGLEYKDQFVNSATDDDDDKRGKLLSQSCIFVDMVPLFREMADEAMGDMLALQKQQLVDLIKPRIQYLGESLKSEESLHEWSEAETALAAAIYHLNHLDQAWASILTKDVFQQSMGNLADVVFTLFANQLLSNKTVILSGNGKQFISALFTKALKEIGEIVVQQEACNEWNRFFALRSYLEMTSIGEVQAGLTKGVFRYIASKELQLLIQGTFAFKYGDSQEYHGLMNALSNFE